MDGLENEFRKLRESNANYLDVVKASLLIRGYLATGPKTWAEVVAKGAREGFGPGLLLVAKDYANRQILDVDGVLELFETPDFEVY